MTFDEDKTKLYKEAIAALERLNTSVTILNRQLQVACALSSSCSAAAKLWHGFHYSINQNDSNVHESVNSNIGDMTDIESFGTVEEGRSGHLVLAVPRTEDMFDYSLYNTSEETNCPQPGLPQ